MEISAEETNLMTNNTSGINTEIKVNGQKLKKVTNFKYSGSVVSDDGSKPEILSRIAQTTAALTRLEPVLNDRNISLSSKVRMMCSIVTFILLYASDSWTVTAELQIRIRATEMRCNHKMLRISLQKLCYQRESPWEDPPGNRTTRRPPDHGKETQTAVVWTCLSFIRSNQNHLARHIER